MLGVITDPDRSQLMNLAVAACRDELIRAIHALSTVPDLSIFLPEAEKPDPALVYPGGSMRQPFSQFVASLLVSAAQRFYFLRQESTPTSFIEVVLENYEEMVRQGRNEPINVYDLIGFTGIELSPGVQVDTPWGVLRAVPSNFRVGLSFNPTMAILATSRTMTLRVSREEAPTPLAIDEPADPRIDGARRLLPLAFALASEQNPRCAPMITFDATLFPLIPLNSYHHPEILFPTQPWVRPSKHEIQEAERWARKLEQSRNGKLQIAERRLVSAIAQRTEKADALVDAVIAWENLVGTTPDTEEKVTTALSNLLESSLAARIALKEELKDVYETRSRVVHGDIAEGDSVSTASVQAIDIGLRALHALHNLPDDWLTITSKTRSRRLRNFPAS